MPEQSGEGGSVKQIAPKCDFQNPGHSHGTSGLGSESLKNSQARFLDRDAATVNRVSSRPQKQIPAGYSRQGSAEKLTDGEWRHPVAHQGPAMRIEFHRAKRCKTILWAKGSRPPAGNRVRPSEFAFRRILRGGNDPAADLSHVFAGIRKLALQELRLNSHRLLKIGRVNQFPRMFERRLHVLFGER